MTARQTRRSDSDLLELTGAWIRQPQRVAVSRYGMLDARHYLATEAGMEMLADGENPMDAAVAAALAPGVCKKPLASTSPLL